MSDEYPPNLTIEIDRLRLTSYLRLKWLFASTLWLTFLGLFGSLSLIARALDSAPTRADTLAIMAKAFGFGLGVAWTLVLILYFLVGRRVTARFAANLEVSVEGAFLRIRQQTLALTDRKLHFRSIVDYMTTQDFLMRCCGIHSLQMNTTGGGLNSFVTIPGVKDCLKMRDMLAEIDRQREKD